jgi:hypothetical protein
VTGLLRPIFDSKKPTALFLGRYQPFHEGHKALIGESGRPASRCATPKGSTRRTPSIYVRACIEHGLREYQGRFVVLPVPNISNILYGRDVGYASSASIWIPRSRRSRPPRRAGNSRTVPAEVARGFASLGTASPPTTTDADARAATASRIGDSGQSSHSAPGEEPDPAIPLSGNQPVAVMLDLMDPLRSDWGL